MSEAIIRLLGYFFGELKEKHMKQNKQKEIEEMKEALKSEYGPWINLTVINIKDFVTTHKLITKHFLINAQHDLHLDFDMEHRGLSMNSQNPMKVSAMIARLKTIKGIEIGEIETIIRDEG